MYKLIRLEIFKVFSRKRSFIAFLAIFAIIIVAMAAMLWEGQAMHEFITKNLSDAFYMQGNLVNGYLMSYLILNFLWVHVPLLVVIVTGDLFSGEAHGGTFRLLLTRPVSRWRLVTVKYIAAIVYTFFMMLFFAATSLGLGILIFGTGDLMIIMEKVNIFSQDDLLWRFLLAYVFGFISMITVAGLSLMLSSMSSNSLGPILSTMAIIILFTLISTFDFSFFRLIKPFLLTSYLDSWARLFMFEFNQQLILRDVIILLIHIILFYGITVVYFQKKDILT
jgi:ABC-2 type transport system permease protein